MTGTVSMSTAGRIASSVAATRPGFIACPAQPSEHQWLVGFGYPRQDKNVLSEVAAT